MSALLKRDPETMNIPASSMQALAAGASGVEDIAHADRIIVVVHAMNRGGDQHYSRFSMFGDNFVNALRETEFAYRMLSQREYDDVMEKLHAEFEEAGMLDVEVHAFQRGEYYAYYETV